MLQRTVTKTTSSGGSFLPGHRYSPVKQQQRDFFFFIPNTISISPSCSFCGGWKSPTPTPAEPRNKPVPSRKLWEFLLLVMFGSGYSIPPCVVSMQQRLTGSCEKAGVYPLGALYEPKIRRGQCVLENIQTADEGEPGREQPPLALAIKKSFSGLERWLRA